MSEKRALLKEEVIPELHRELSGRRAKPEFESKRIGLPEPNRKKWHVEVFDDFAKNVNASRHLSLIPNREVVEPASDAAEGKHKYLTQANQSVRLWLILVNSSSRLLLLPEECTLPSIQISSLSSSLRVHRVRLLQPERGRRSHKSGRGGHLFIALSSSELGIVVGAVPTAPGNRSTTSTAAICVGG